MVVVSSLILTGIYLNFMDQILAMFGGTVNAETFRYSREYFYYIASGIPFYMFGQALNPIIRSDGSPKFAMASTLAGAVLNIILDPVFEACKAFKKGFQIKRKNLQKNITARYYKFPFPDISGCGNGCDQ